MSLNPEKLVIDTNTVASNPGGVRVNPFRYARHFPKWPTIWGVGLLASIALAMVRPGQFVWAIFLLVFNIIHWLQVMAHFRLGCVNPSVVLEVNPLTLAVSTDLTTGGDLYPAIKILTHPAPADVNLKKGDRCATVAVYQGSSNADYWEDFTPRLADCVTADRATVKRVVESIPAEEWAALEAGLAQVPKPLKPGLYRVKPTPEA
jgi:hypothetical protein